MTEREKVIKIIQNSVDDCDEYWAGVIADELLNSGVIIPPCRVGDKFYIIPTEIQYCRLRDRNEIAKYINNRTAKSFKVDNDGVKIITEYDEYIDPICIGKTWFLSEREAKEVLNKYEENYH